MAQFLFTLCRFPRSPAVCAAVSRYQTLHIQRADPEGAESCAVRGAQTAPGDGKSHCSGNRDCTTEDLPWIV